MISMFDNYFVIYIFQAATKISVVLWGILVQGVSLGYEPVPESLQLH